ncbi:Sec-independent protein translocase protein TatB [Glaesserella sp.]|uniref:Sec-independent protein translocase protein TatB n=1 Tax=Glaesserella sp. TaxID=2094731 RepID=UPI0035A0EC31
MFDIGFSELVLVFIVGLVVLGPKRLPIAIRTVMGWVRTIRGLAANVQNELAQELKLQELQESIKKAEALNLSKLSPELSKTVEELKQSAQKMQADLTSAKSDIQHLTEEQVAEIQNKIEQESQTLASGNLQNSESNAPLVDVETTEPQLSEAEIAELAEADEEKLMAYYPPDDDLASVDPQPKQDKQNVS